MPAPAWAGLQDGLQQAQAQAQAEPDGLSLLRAADRTLREADGLAFTIHREGSGAQATREPYTTARVVLARGPEATRGGLLDADGRPQWKVAAFGRIATADGMEDPFPFAFAFDGEKVRSIDRAQWALLEGGPEATADLLTSSGALAALQWLSDWETLVGQPVVDNEPREAPRLDGTVVVGDHTTNAVYVDLAEFPGTFAFGAWWYLDTRDTLPRRLELVYYDVRAEDNQSVGDGISRWTLSDVRPLHDPTEIAAAVTHAARLLDETNWGERNETPLSAFIDPADPFALPAPEGFEAKAFQPPQAQGQARAAAEPALNIPAPDFTLTDPDGVEHTLSDYRGKIVVIDFWATWCGPCLMVMPHLQAIHEQFKDQGVVVMGVNAWENGDPQALMKARSWDYLLLLGGDQVAADYQVTGIPTMVVVGPDGTIVQRKVGAGPDVKAELLQTITALQGQN
jgi:thiol-disulfide isomerase/thioredoxin